MKSYANCCPATVKRRSARRPLNDLGDDRTQRFDRGYYPATGRPQLRDTKFFIIRDECVVDPEATRKYTCSTPSAHVPLPAIVHRGEAAGGPYTLNFTFLPDPHQVAVLVAYALERDITSFRPVAAAAAFVEVGVEAQSVSDRADF